MRAQFSAIVAPYLDHRNMLTLVAIHALRVATISTDWTLYLLTVFVLHSLNLSIAPVYIAIDGPARHSMRADISSDTRFILAG